MKDPTCPVCKHILNAAAHFHDDPSAEVSIKEGGYVHLCSL